MPKHEAVKKQEFGAMARDALGLYLDQCTVDKRPDTPGQEKLSPEDMLLVWLRLNGIRLAPVD